MDIICNLNHVYQPNTKSSSKCIYTDLIETVLAAYISNTAKVDSLHPFSKSQ